MRRRRKTPRTWEDLPARRMFLEQHPLCQLCRVLRPNELSDLAACIHHVLGRGWIGADTPANFCAVCDACHAAVGRTNQGKVLSLYAKMLAGELDVRGLDNAGGFIMGRIENWTPELAEPVRGMAVKLVDFSRTHGA